jgi:CIC family chloride channel protein
MSQLEKIRDNSCFRFRFFNFTSEFTGMKRFSRSITKFRIFLRWLIRWVSRNIARRNYQIIVSLIIGIVAGLTAVALKWLVFLFRNWLHGQDPSSERFFFVFFPVIGIGLALGFVRFLLRKPLDPGLGSLIYAISKKRVNLPRYESYAHVVSSSLTIGFGGSAGLEAPIIRTGSAIGSNLARILRVGRNKQTLFLACGAAAGMAAIFNSPVAAVIFAFEVLVTDIGLPSFIPLLISAATGAVVAKALYYERLFYISAGDWQPETIPFYILLGVLCGLLSVYIIRTTIWSQGYFNRPGKQLLRFGLGGLAIGLLIFFIPPLFGEGYETVNHLLTGNASEMVDHSLFYQLGENEWFLIVFAVLLVLAKGIATAITIAIGGNGGVFAPTMFSGAAFGFIFVHLINRSGWVELYEANFIVVAMAGLLSGVFKSPLTGIFIIAEITGGYSLFVPLMIVSALSYFVTYYFEPQSIFTRELYLKGLWVPTHERDRHLLSNLEIQSLIEKDFTPVSPEMPLGEFVKVIGKSRRNLFPVIDQKQHLEGIILLDDVREMMFDRQKYDEVHVANIMHNPPAIVEIGEPMDKVMEKFDQHDVWNLPVVENGIYLGFVSKSSIFGQYRNLLRDKGSSDL